MKRQKGVTAEAIKAIKKSCKEQFDDLNISDTEAFVKPKGSLGDITFSGRTIRKIFNGEYIRPATVRKLMDELKLDRCITNGKIDIVDDGE